MVFNIYFVSVIILYFYSYHILFSSNGVTILCHAYSLINFYPDSYKKRTSSVAILLIEIYKKFCVV